MNVIRLLSAVTIVIVVSVLLSCGGGTSSGSNPNPNPNPNDSVAPSVAMTPPAGGSGTVSLSATASDNVGVAGVQFLYDGQPLGAEVLFPPYTVAWNTTTSSNGSHMISARARDAAGNQTTTTAVGVTVNNPAPPGTATTFTLQPTQRFQTWQAWMGTSNGSSIPTLNGFAAPPANLLSAALDEIVFDLGINGLRMAFRHNAEPVNDNSNAFSINSGGFDFDTPLVLPTGERVDPAQSRQVIVNPVRQRVQSRGEPFVSYVSTTLQYSSMPSHLHNADEFAEYVEAAMDWQQSVAGFLPTYITLANEPDAGFFNSGELINDTIKTGQRLQAKGIATKILTPDTVDADAAAVQFILSDPATLPHIGIIAFHGYDYFGSIPASFVERNAVRTLARQFNLPTAMTEICCRAWDGSYLGQGLAVARDIYWNMTEADISIWAQFGLVWSCGQVGCTDGGEHYINFDPNHSRYFKLGNYYAMRQYSRYIRPGYVRVGLGCSGCTSNSTIGQVQKAVAFQSPAGKLVVVVLNDQNNSARIALAGLPAGTYNITGVDPVNITGVGFAPMTIGSGQSLAVTFPGRAILTFVQR